MTTAERYGYMTGYLRKQALELPSLDTPSEETDRKLTQDAVAGKNLVNAGVPGYGASLADAGLREWFNRYRRLPANEQVDELADAATGVAPYIPMGPVWASIPIADGLGNLASPKRFYRRVEKLTSGREPSKYYGGGPAGVLAKIHEFVKPVSRPASFLTAFLSDTKGMYGEANNAAHNMKRRFQNVVQEVTGKDPQIAADRAKELRDIAAVNDAVGRTGGEALYANK
jgi:hypothetical protein